MVKKNREKVEIFIRPFRCCCAGIRLLRVYIVVFVVVLEVVNVVVGGAGVVAFVAAICVFLLMF